jgi:hypothetical protein
MKMSLRLAAYFWDEDYGLSVAPDIEKNLITHADYMLIGDQYRAG